MLATIQPAETRMAPQRLSWRVAAAVSALAAVQRATVGGLASVPHGASTSLCVRHWQRQLLEQHQQQHRATAPPQIKGACVLLTVQYPTSAKGPMVWQYVQGVAFLTNCRCTADAVMQPLLAVVWCGWRLCTL
jgi:hypothetical protein